MGWTGTHDGTAADILERLRVFNPCADADWFATIRDAMSEIERLRADLAGAKAAAGTAIDATVDFVLGHHEEGPAPFSPTRIDPDTWWSKVQILPTDPHRLLPKSREHYDARVRRWKECARGALGSGNG